MKCLVTGHTRGIGKHIYECLLKHGHEVEGVSKSNGYDIETSYDIIINKAKTVDLFVNNAYVKDYQYRFLNDLNNSVKNIVTIGSSAGYYNVIDSVKQEYIINKSKLIHLNRRLVYTSNSNLLLLNVGLTENASTDFGCSFEDITDMLMFWLSKPNISQIDFSVKLSDTNIELIEKDFNIKISDYRDEFF